MCCTQPVDLRMVLVIQSKSLSLTGFGWKSFDEEMHLKGDKMGALQRFTIQQFMFEGYCQRKCEESFAPSPGSLPKCLAFVYGLKEA